MKAEEIPFHTWNAKLQGQKIPFDPLEAPPSEFSQISDSEYPDDGFLRKRISRTYGGSRVLDLKFKIDG